MSTKSKKGSRRVHHYNNNGQSLKDNKSNYYRYNKDKNNNTRNITIYVVSIIFTFIIGITCHFIAKNRATKYDKGVSDGTKKCIEIHEIDTPSSSSKSKTTSKEFYYNSENCPDEIYSIYLVSIIFLSLFCLLLCIGCCICSCFLVLI